MSPAPCARRCVPERLLGWLAGVLCCVGVASAQSLMPPDAQRALMPVLERAAAYVADYEANFAGVVAEEDYTQQTFGPPQFNSNGMLTSSRTGRRRLRSDLLIVKPNGADRWVQFRDVFEVNGKPVRDRNDRLAKLFLSPTGSLNQQVLQIMTESARYNLGAIQRNINLPVLALLVLHPAYQSGFAFRQVSGTDGPAAVPDLPELPRISSKTEVWAIDFVEAQSPTLIHTNDFRDLPTRGRFWIETATGRVLMTELIAEDATLRGRIDVAYQRDEALDLLVPAQMRELYELKRDGSTIDGAASYSRVRRFQVATSEIIGDPDAPADGTPAAAQKPADPKKKKGGGV